MNPRVFLDLEIDSKKVGRVVIELFKDVAPKSSENFRALCTGELNETKRSRKLHYKGVLFHRIINGFMIQSGALDSDSENPNWSIYGESFQDENMSMKIDRKYLLCMANKGPNTNGSQFFITTRENCEHLNGKNVVFGRIVSGFDIIDEIEKVPVKEPKRPDLPGSKPLVKVLISHCGELLPIKKPKPAPKAKRIQNKRYRDSSDSSNSSDSSGSESGSSSQSDSSKDSSSSSDRKSKRKAHKKRKEAKRKIKSKRRLRYSDTSSSGSRSESESVSSSNSSFGDYKRKRSDDYKRDLRSSASINNAPLFTPRSRWEDDRFVKPNKYSSRRERLDERSRSYRSRSDRSGSSRLYKYGSKYSNRSETKPYSRPSNNRQLSDEDSDVRVRGRGAKKYGG